MSKKNKKTEHEWTFVQNSGLIQVKISSIDDVLNIPNLDPKLWTALACPTEGLEFSKETLDILDADKNGRVRLQEIIEAVNYIKKYFSKPEIIMEKSDTLPLDALNQEPFECGHSPLSSAKSVLNILGKSEKNELSLNDLNVNEKLFSPDVFNGDGVLTKESVPEENIKALIEDIINCTGGTEDISGVIGITRNQVQEFFENIKSIKQWEDQSLSDDPKIFFLKGATDTAANSFSEMQEKINDYYLRCALLKYDNDASPILKTQTDSLYIAEDGSLADAQQLSKLPLSLCAPSKPLMLDETINPIWKEKIQIFKKDVLLPIFGKSVESLSENNWRKIEALFEPYLEWRKQMPQNSASVLGIERITEILNSDMEMQLIQYLEKEEKHPPMALATVELKKLLLLRRDFLELIQNFVSFECFYEPDKKAVFQCGTLFIDGRACDLCFKILNMTKHSAMAALSQCYLLYCDCVKKDESGEKMQIAALVSNGETDNIIVGRNGLFVDRQGQDWDATIVKIIENPISIKQAFWSPYKRLIKFIQEKIAKTTSAQENSVFEKMTKSVENPKDATANLPTKKTDIGTVAALSVAFTGIATVVGGILHAFFGLGIWIPVGIIGIILIISLPSMLIAWRKLRQRNIAPILDASGWAINGNVKISPVFGSALTHLPNRPITAYLSKKDPYASKKFPVKRVITAIVLLAIIIVALVLILKNPNGIQGVWSNIKNIGNKFLLVKNL